MNVSKMHRYIIGWVVLFVAVVVTLPMAMIRVSKTEKFAEQPFNSLTCEGQMPDSRAVTQFSACAQMQANPVAQASTPQSPSAVPVVAASQKLPASQTSNSLIDPFVEAFRLAEQAVAQGRIAQTSADWHSLAPQWQQAAALMSRVLPDDPRYSIAQQRIALYRQNHQVVLKRAGSLSP